MKILNRLFVFFIVKSLNFIQFKKFFYKRLDNPPRKVKIFSNLKTNKNYIVEIFNIDSYPVYTIYKNYSMHEKKARFKKYDSNDQYLSQKLPKNHIIFFHGGGYIFKETYGHKVLVFKLLKMLDIKISFFDYPLAPENDYKKTLEIVEKGYFKLLEKYPDDDFIFMGDSAGGGLALAFNIKLIKDNLNYLPKRIPRKSILLSPWLDLSLSNPDIKQYEKKDPILSYEILKKAALMYSKAKDLSDPILKNPLLSPIYRNFDDDGQILIFTGTNEILYPDCLLFEQKVKNSKNRSIKLIIEEEFIHDWLVFPFPGKKKAFIEIAKFINS
ncbi:MAG: alpha/beta hydrolase fold domain-containing protein [Exilispira sp.]